MVLCRGSPGRLPLCRRQCCQPAAWESSQLLSDDYEDMEDSEDEDVRSEPEGRAAEREKAAAFALMCSRQPCLRRKSRKLRQEEDYY